MVLGRCVWGLLGMTRWTGDRKQHHFHSGQERFLALSLKAIFLLINCFLGLILAFYSSVRNRPHPPFSQPLGGRDSSLHL